MTPFGNPVVPLVKLIVMMSEDFIVGYSLCYLAFKISFRDIVLIPTFSNLLALSSVIDSNSIIVLILLILFGL
jgi:hypothetical protein